MCLKVYRSATPPAESSKPQSPKPVALPPSQSNAEPAAPGSASSSEEPPANRRWHSCEEIAYQPPQATPVVKGTVTTPPATTQPIGGGVNFYFCALSFLLTGTQSEYVNLRSILCEWMENHRKLHGNQQHANAR